MATVLFLRSIEVEQTRPHLADCQQWLSGRGIDDHLLFSDGEVSPTAYAGTTNRVSGKGTLADFTDAFKSVAPPDGVGVSISIPDENVVRDAVLAKRQRGLGRSVLAPSVETALCLSSKWETKQLLRFYEIPTPRGFYVDGDLLAGRASVRMDYDEALSEVAQDLSFPVIIKPIWDCLGNGMLGIDSPEDFKGWLRSGGMGANCIVEEFVDGILCSVECISDGRQAIFQPIVWKGHTGAAESFAFEQVRWAHSSVTLDELDPGLASKIRDMVLASGLTGAYEFEFIQTVSSFTCIEVNPRVSGSTAMSIAASDINTFVELCKIALGEWAPHDVPRDVAATALQFPLLPGESPREALQSSTATVLRVSDFEVEGIKYPSALISVSDTGLPSFENWFRSAGVEIVSKSTSKALLQILEERITSARALPA
jgi:hypothetical protein